MDDLRSAPLKAFWKGVEEEGWPAHARPVNLSGFVSVVTTQMGTGSRQDFAEASFALLSAQYMLLSLHLGYHFTTFESMLHRRSRARTTSACSSRAAGPRPTGAPGASAW